MELQNERLFDVRERAVRKWILPALVVVLVVGLPAVWFGPRVYSHWQQERLLRRAREGLQKNEVPIAAITLRRVLNLNPDNLEATRAMAKLAETYLPSEAPALHERVCQLAPDSLPDATAWALAALRIGQTVQADDAFERMKKLGPPSVAFHEIGGHIALDFGRLEEARGHFARALELDPTKESNQLELAAIEIRQPDVARQDAARETLGRLRENPKLRPTAVRALVADRIDHEMINEALALAQDFVIDPEATFHDRLQYLAILRTREDPSFVFTTTFDEKSRIPLGLVPGTQERTFASYLNDLQAEARDDAAKVASLIAFLNSRRLSLLACEWTRTMKPEFISVPPIAPPLAEAFRLTLDWRRLEELVAEGEWGFLEFMRFAYWSRVVQEKGDRATAVVHWATAIKLAEYRHERLVALARTVSAWGWSNEFEEILWISARNSKRPREALEELARIYREKRDAQKLLTIWSSLLELDPADVTARKQWVRLALLLLPNERFRAGTVAQELYRAQPEDAEIATSYALVLHFRLQHREGLAVMSKLTPEQLRTPAVAGYYAIFLFANDQREETAKFLALAQDATLLREERELIDQTRRSLERTPPRP